MNDKSTVHRRASVDFVRSVCIMFVQVTPLPTKPGISLIILKPIKILQREYIRCVRNEEECVCSAPSCCGTEQRSASQPVSCLTRLSAYLCHLAEDAYVIRLLFVSVVYSVSSHSWKMYRYTLEERVFIVRTYWKTESIKLCQQQFLEKFGGRHPPSKYCIWALSKKLEIKGTLLDELTGGRPKMSEETIQNVKDRLQASPKKPLRRLSQESGLSRNTCQRAAKKAKLRAYRISVLHELGEPDQVKRVA